jgi:antitoxin CptB
MSDPRLNKIRFRAWRRGFREADLILGPFADEVAGALGASELDEFERLLDQPDHDLYGWIIGRDPAPAEFDGPVLARLKAFHLTLGAQGAGRGA